MKNNVIAVIGLGYVGLPLAIEFGKKYQTIGFDINKKRIAELKNGIDTTLEVGKEGFENAKSLTFSSTKQDLQRANIFIITVPTPIDKNNMPNLSALFSASETVGSVLTKSDIVIYESTVYPGCTEEDCIPVLEKTSGLIFNEDFFCGYSPERINPGDKVNSLTTIQKVVSGSNEQTLNIVDDLYKSILKADTFRASSIKVAEASKAIENAQRDINIAFVNELSLIFEKMDIDTNEVLEAAGTKWNFLKFQPGLVGGHCIGVDPYYLSYKSSSLGYQPKLIIAGREINDNMGYFISNKVIRLMIDKEISIKNSKVLILGFTFKENCPDIRNTRVIDIVEELEKYSCNVDVHDSFAIPSEVKSSYGIDLISDNELKTNVYDAVILAVSHYSYKSIDISQLKNDKTVVYDVKGSLNDKTIHRL